MVARCARKAVAAALLCVTSTGCSALFGFEGFGGECANLCEAGPGEASADAATGHDASGGADASDGEGGDLDVARTTDGADMTDAFADVLSRDATAGDAGVEAGSGPTGLALGTATATAEAVGAIMDHDPFSDVCPLGQVVVGYAGQQASTNYMQIQSTCGTLALSGTGPWTVTIGPGMSFPVHGTELGISWTRMCPTNQAIVGFVAQYNTSVEGLTFSCAPLVVSEDGTAVAVGAVTMLPFVGNDNTKNVTGTCAAGSVATVTSGWFSPTGSVTGFGLSCSPVSLAF